MAQSDTRSDEERAVDDAQSAVWYAEQETAQVCRCIAATAGHSAMPLVLWGMLGDAYEKRCRTVSALVAANAALAAKAAGQ